jgi:hypothetical protein
MLKFLFVHLITWIKKYLYRKKGMGDWTKT